MQEFIHSGFQTIQKDLDTKSGELSAALLDSQKDHLEVFRQLVFTLGDLEYRKEKRMEEVGANIQAAHIQQELCSDSLNPSAKKFSDAKKELLRVRDALEAEVREIRGRIDAAHTQYVPTEDALQSANVEHVHPMEALEERRLATRAKMVEYRAISLGNVSSIPVQKELEDLRKSLNSSRQQLLSITNTSASRTTISSFLK
jgi:hypothetical protein